MARENVGTTGDVPGRCVFVTTFEMAVNCQLLFIPTSWHRVLVYQNTQHYKYLLHVIMDKAEIIPC